MRGLSGECVGSVTVTGGIRVVVAPRYMPGESAPEHDRFVFAYHITITNEGPVRARLVTRHWIIVDADGDRRDVRGPGVVGHSPDLAPGESFEYESFCPLSTPWGTMEGEYQMVRDDGRRFAAAIDRFYLVAPVREPSAAR